MSAASTPSPLPGCGLAGGSRPFTCRAALRPAPAGIVPSRWVWALIFSPLWASTFINFGLGPIITRTDDLAPVAANTAAFLLTAGAFVLRGPLSRALRPPQEPRDG